MNLEVREWRMQRSKERLRKSNRNDVTNINEHNDLTGEEYGKICVSKVRQKNHMKSLNALFTIQHSSNWIIELTD